MNRLELAELTSGVGALVLGVGIDFYRLASTVEFPRRAEIVRTSGQTKPVRLWRWRDSGLRQALGRHGACLLRSSHLFEGIDMSTATITATDVALRNALTLVTAGDPEAGHDGGHEYRA